jgi:hypothetical protein
MVVANRIKELVYGAKELVLDLACWLDLVAWLVDWLVHWLDLVAWLVAWLDLALLNRRFKI